MKSFFCRLLMFVLLSGCTALAAEQVTLTNRAGQSIQARILNYQNDSVQIQTPDSRIFTLDLQTLNEESQKLVKTWHANKLLNSGALEVTVTRKKLNRQVENTGYYRRETAELQHTITVRNVSLGRPIPKLEVKYLLIHRPRTYYEMRQRPRIVYRGTATFENLNQFGTDSTVMKPIDSYSYRYGAITYEDDVEGIWVRLYENGKLIGEHQEPTGFFAGRAWEDEYQKGQAFP